MFPAVVLCVDDRPDWLEARKGTLEPLGYSVITATDVAMAITLLEALPIDAVLLEYGSSGIDAEGVAFQIKAHFPSQPIILLSALPELPDRTLGLVDDYLMNSQLDLLPASIARVSRPANEKVPGAA